jgi:hypothetical protein
MPFGSFMDAVPTPAFLVIHTVLVVIGVTLWRRAKRVGNAAATRGFLLYIVAEICYLTYHLDLTRFLFAHTLAEVCDALAFLSLGMGITARPA